MHLKGMFCDNLEDFHLILHQNTPHDTYNLSLKSPPEALRTTEGLKYTYI